MIPWELKADELVACNCAYGCPCQFNALPTHGHCEAAASFHVRDGHFGETRLDDLCAVAILSWPGPIHEGGGKAAMIIDERADEAQRQALVTILSGEETYPGATVWNVFAGTLVQLFEPVYKPIVFDVNVEARAGRVRVEGIADVKGEPIRNPVTGQTHRARIDLPDGFEYSIAEMGSATFDTTGPIRMSHTASYAQFAHIHLNNHGIVKPIAA